jgi:hypothetical protein
MKSYFSKLNHKYLVKEGSFLKKQLFSLAICLILVTSSLTFLIKIKAAPAGDGFLEVDVPPRGTFLHAIDGFPYDGAGDRIHDDILDLNIIVGSYYNVEDPAIVDLQGEGFGEGDKIIITFTASIYYDGTYHPTNPDAAGWPLHTEEDLFWEGLLGVFSSSSSLLSINSTNRVPDAVPLETLSMNTPPTKWSEHLQDISDKLLSNGIAWYTGPEETDIPDDFLIKHLHEGVELTIPRNAKFLFLCCIDDLYYDNLGEITVTIEKDSDEDGLPDSWEKNGIDINHDNIIDLDLPGLKARWDHKDIFVEIDYMGSSAGHNHDPIDGAIEDVKRAFANAPVTNPDNTNGITLHVLQDQAVPHKDEIDWNDFYQIKKEYFGTKSEQDSPNKQYILEARKMVYHYCLFAHLQKGGTWSGSGELKGNDFMVTLGAFSGSTGDRGEQAATFMHELGHNLGLDHGGGDDENFKPNYLSVMNYMFIFEFRHVATRPLDYSRIKLDTINEIKIDEIKGVGVSVIPTYETQWFETGYSFLNYTTNTYQLTVVPLKPIDYGQNGAIDDFTYIYNLNEYPQWNQTTGLDELRGYNDWENLVYRFRGYPSFAEGPNPSIPEDEITFELAEAIRNDAQEFEGNPQPIESKSSVGVEKGDWMEYSAYHSGNYPDDLSKRFSMKVEDIDGTRITVSGEGQNLDGKDWSISETYDLETGFHDFLLIPSGLDVGDQFHHEDFGNIIIGGIEKYPYAGEERTVIWSIFSGHALHWDQATGILCQADWNWSSDYEVRWTLDKTSLWGQTSSGAQARENGKIAFTSTRDGNYEIYVMNADGTEQTRLTNNNANDYDPFYSPDGKKILFWTNRDGNYEIYVMNSDGTQQTRLTNNNYSDEQPSWSPDGKKIAFPSNRDGNLEIYVMNADGTGQTRLTYNNAADEQPRWSPDGSMIAFNTDRDGNMEIYVMNSDGTDQTRITYSDGRDEDPDWSPDRKKFAFFSERDGNCEIYVMNIDGSQPMRLTNSIADDSDPCWSPDGSKIVFDSFRDGNWNIYSINADGSELVRLTSNEALDWGPIWQGVEKSAAFPFELIIIVAVALCAFIIFILLITKRKKKKEKQVENIIPK